MKAPLAALRIESERRFPALLAVGLAGLSAWAVAYFIVSNPDLIALEFDPSRPAHLWGCLLVVVFATAVLKIPPTLFMMARALDWLPLAVAKMTTVGLRASWATS